MLKFCRECDRVMPGDAAFCPRCGIAWLQPLPHSLAEAADLLQPPVVCGSCRKHLSLPSFFCPRCGAGIVALGTFPQEEAWDCLGPTY